MDVAQITTIQIVLFLRLWPFRDLDFRCRVLFLLLCTFSVCMQMCCTITIPIIIVSSFFGHSAELNCVFLAFMLCNCPSVFFLRSSIHSMLILNRLGFILRERSKGTAGARSHVAKILIWLMRLLSVLVCLVWFIFPLKYILQCWICSTEKYSKANW